MIADALREIPQFRRGLVWCRNCGRQERVDAVACTMGAGWPVCCGETMTLDSPEERRAYAARAKALG